MFASGKKLEILDFNSADGTNNSFQNYVPMLIINPFVVLKVTTTQLIYCTLWMHIFGYVSWDDGFHFLKTKN